VDHAPFVGVAQRVGHLEGDMDRVLDRELRFAIEPVAERLALDEGHDVIEEPVGFSRVVQAEDVGMLELRGEADFAVEPLGADGGAELRVEDLDRHLAVVLDVLREEDGGHPARAELPLDAVPVGNGRLQSILGLAHGSGVVMGVLRLTDRGT